MTEFQASHKLLFLSVNQIVLLYEIRISHDNSEAIVLL